LARSDFQPERRRVWCVVEGWAFPSGPGEKRWLPRLSTSNARSRGFFPEPNGGGRICSETASGPGHMPDNENDLRRAKEIVAEAQRFVHEQKGKIIRLKTAGLDTCDAEKILQLFQTNLKVFEDHRDSLQRTTQ
jgi:hypothetical protein